jgi:hypothetical protein
LNRSESLQIIVIASFVDEGLRLSLLSGFGLRLFLPSKRQLPFDKSAEAVFRASDATTADDSIVLSKFQV